MRVRGSLPTGFPWALGALLLVIALLARPLWTAGADSSTLQIEASASAEVVEAGERLSLSVTVHNSSATAGQSTSIVVTLPSGFAYVAGTAELLSNGSPLSTASPTVSGQTLSWSGLTLPAARTTSAYGMHTFVQDKWSDTSSQLNYVLQVAGSGAYVTQLMYGITASTQGPAQSWIDFVNGCYDRGLVPVVRLAGEYDGGRQYWVKPAADSAGDYSSIAAAVLRVVSGLPRRDGHLLYIEVWNEPNLDLEWSGAANPVEYGNFLVDVAAAIRSLGDTRIRITNGALSPMGNYARLGFIDAMAAVSGAMQAFDVWATHPYPGNHPPEYNIHDDTAPIWPELTIDSYLLELERLANQGRTGLQVLITETGYRLGANDFTQMQGYPVINEAVRADYIARALRDYWGQWPEVLGVCPFELVDPYGTWTDWDWLYTNGSERQQYTAVKALDKTPSVVQGELEVRFDVTAASVGGSYTSRVSVTTSNLGSLSISGLAPVQVAGPTPTPSSTPTSGPSPTPTATPAYYTLSRNGGFEQESDWNLPYTAYSAGYSDAFAHGGSYSMRIGIPDGTPMLSWSSARQSFHVPEGADGIRIRFWYYPLAGSTDYDRQYVLLTDATGTRETILWTVSDARQWTYFEHQVAGYAGETLWLHLGVRNDAEAGTAAMYVDDVTIEAYGSAGLLSVPRIWLPLISSASSGEATASVATSTSWPEVQPDVESERPEGLAALTVRGATDTPPISALAWDDLRRRLIVSTDGQLSAVDGVTGRTLFAVPLAEPASALAVDESTGTIYATLPSRGELQVRAADGTLRQVVADLGRPVALARDDERLYVADALGKRVITLDAQGCGIISVRDLSVAPQALALDSEARRLYVAQMGNPQITVWQADTLDPLGQVVLGSAGYPLALALDAASQRLYVAHAFSPKYGALSVIDTQQLVVLATLWGNPERPLGGADAVAADVDAGTVFLRTAEGLLTLDTQTLAVRDVARVSVIGVPGTLAYDKLDGTAYFAATDGRLWSLKDSLQQEVSP